MKRILFSIALLTGTCSFAQNEVNSTAFNAWIGYMNVFDLSMNYQFGNAWGVSDLKSDIDSTADQITLYPNFNTYANAVNTGGAADIDYWTNSPDGGTTPGTTGNKILEALTFVEPTGYNGQDLTFKGNVQSNTLDGAYVAKYFIKALDPANGYQDAFGGSKTFDIPASGEFSVTATGAELAPGLIVQFGFSVTGVNANPADAAALGSIVIVPSTLGISDLSHEDVVIFPNPVNNELNLNGADAFNNFSIINVDGRTVLVGNLTTANIDVSDLNEGIYTILLTDKNGKSRVQRFVKN